MHSGAQAYANTAQKTANPRELEAQLLIRAANRLQSIVEGRTVDSEEMREALRYNRKLWTVLSTSATAADNPLPPAIKQNIGNIAMFVLPHCVELENTPVPQRMVSLVNINRELAAGLMHTAPAAA